MNDILYPRVDFSDPPEATELRRLEKAIKSMKRQIRGVGCVRRRKPLTLHKDRRPRLTWPCWLRDWYTALNSMGWECCNKHISTCHGRMGKPAFKKLTVLYMHRNGIVICLHPHLAKLPMEFSLLDSVDLGTTTPDIKETFHIVRGTRYYSLNRETPLAYAVEYNGELDTTLCFLGLWNDDARLKAHYQEYLEASPHHRAMKNFKWFGRYEKHRESRLRRLSISLPAIDGAKVGNIFHSRTALK